MRVSRPAPRDTLLTIAEVLAELQVAHSTFDTWRSLGSAPECIKLPTGRSGSAAARSIYGSPPAISAAGGRGWVRTNVGKARDMWLSSLH
jgi:hypothetical protein